jgi:hypothetical protein
LPPRRCAGRRCRRVLWPRLTVVAGGVVVGFPSFLARAPAHRLGARVIAVLPATTSAAAVLRAASVFWLAALAGVAVVTAFAIGEAVAGSRRRTPCCSCRS